jgi:hypothetical protein
VGVAKVISFSIQYSGFFLNIGGLHWSWCRGASGLNWLYAAGLNV